MNIRLIDPTEVSNWDSLLLKTGEIDFFHSSFWAKVLKESYRYKPLYCTASENGRLSFSWPWMEVQSVWTGKRGVSLPFTDQCKPYFLDRRILKDAIEALTAYGKNAGWRYIEWRTRANREESGPSWEDYFEHEIELAGYEENLFTRLIPSNRRNIRRAVRAGLSVEISASWDAMNSFCRLNSLTRKRHGLPPQPLRFFEMVFEHVLSTGHGLVFSARHGNRVIASSVFFHFGKRALFKYGTSDLRFHPLRPNNLIMWEAIRWYRSHDYTALNLGRTELDNPGLLRYKQGWGAEERRLRYFRYGLKEGSLLGKKPRRVLHKRVLTKIPSRLLCLLGRLAYRHMG